VHEQGAQAPVVRENVWRLRTRALSTSLLDLLFPPRCVGCRRAGSLLCDHCAQTVRPLAPPLCPRCGQPQQMASLCRVCARLEQNPLTMARGCAAHAGVLRAAIHALKYDNEPRLAPLLGRYLVAGFAGAEWDSVRGRIDAIAPVPLHERRQAQRGYNQSELLARHLALATEIPLQLTWLTRTRDTQPQVGKNASERQINVADSFHASQACTGHTLLLVDDVYTTGATIRACAQAALQAGARAFYAITLARPLLDDDLS